jgi:hypothetical protein
MVGVPILKNTRESASIFLGIMVRIEYQRQGIGKISMENNLDLADNWLMFVRMSLKLL